MTQRRVKGFRRWQLRTPPYLPSSLQCAHTCRSYEILVSAESREAYDRYGMEGMARGGAGGGFGPGVNPEDIFAELFGGVHFGFDFGGPGSRGPRRTKGQDSNIPYEVTLEDLYNGKTVKMNMEKEVVCGVCKG